MPRVLVVEDDPDVASVVRMCLARPDYRIRLVRTLHAARRVLAGGRRFDLVVVDVLLPDGDGLDLCRELKAARVPVRILVLTARAEARAEAVAAGADAFIAKPFDPSELESAAGRLLGADR